MRDDLPVWRSLLFVPANVERFVAKAHTRGADAIQIDLEDSIPPALKDEARAAVRDVAPRVRQGGADVVVRINRPLRLAIPDIEASIGPDVDALALPKIDNAAHVRLIAEVIEELERERGLRPGHTRLIAMVETAGAFFELKDIAAAHPRVVGITLGSEDFSLSAGMLPEPDGLYVPKITTVIAARAAGILPLGFLGSIAEYKDVEAFRATVRRSRKLGFRGAGCVHPNQVAVLNECFAPEPDEVEHARGMLGAYERAYAEGRGSVEYQGKMIDIPVVERAREVVQSWEKIQERETRAG